MKPSDIEKTAFITHVGLLEMQKMPFGFCNAPSTYPRLMAGVLQKLIGRICLAYLDDMIIFSEKRSEYAANLLADFDRIRSANLKLKPSKCSLFADQMLYFSHVISAAGVSPDVAKLRVLADWMTPTMVREIQSFLIFVNFYGDDISDATKLTAPLYNFTPARKGDESLTLTAEHLESNKEIKRQLCAVPRLAHPNLEQPFVLYINASKIAVGAVLLQCDNSRVKRAISFFSK